MDAGKRAVVPDGAGKNIGNIIFFTVINNTVVNVFSLDEVAYGAIVSYPVYSVKVIVMSKGLALLAVMFFRIVSRNLARRRAENQRFVNWWWRMKSSRQGARERHADKDHKYFTCKNCKTICRVPVGKGKIIITCPKCGAQIHAKT